MATAGAPAIVALAASLRAGSWNGRLLRRLVEGAEAAGGRVTVVDLTQYPMPIYDADLEEGSGLPDPAKRLKELLRAHAGLLVTMPEYNGGMPPLLVNLLAWTSRPEVGERPGVVFREKPLGLGSASPAPTGGLRVLGQAAAIFGNLGAIVVPYPVGISDAGQAFAATGTGLANPGLDQRVLAVGAGVVDLARRLTAAAP